MHVNLSTIQGDGEETFIISVNYVQMLENCPTNRKPENDRNSGNYDQILFNSGESSNEFTQ